MFTYFKELLNTLKLIHIKLDKMDERLAKLEACVGHPKPSHLKSKIVLRISDANSSD